MLDALDQSISLADLARLCDLSPSHFSRAFKNATGQSPSLWLAAERVSRAKDLLRRGEHTLAEIAYGCGFADQSHLTRTFSRHVGQSPGAWRRQRR
jgi:transcriptional regulator GlxA family with amidase domain